MNVGQIATTLREEASYFLKRHCQAYNEDMRGWMPELRTSHFGAFKFFASVNEKVIRLNIL